MKFAKQLEESRQFEFEGCYIEYATLKQLIRKMESLNENNEVSIEYALWSSQWASTSDKARTVETGEHNSLMQQLTQIINKELKKVKEFLDIKKSMIMNSGFATLREADSLLASLEKKIEEGLGREDCAGDGESSTFNLDEIFRQEALSQLDRLKSLNRKMADDLVKMDVFMLINKEGFRKIVKKADRRLGTHLGLMLETESINSLDWNSSRERLIVILSELNEKARRIHEILINQCKIDSENEWVPPSDFERQTRKFWVKLEV